MTPKTLRERVDALSNDFLLDDVLKSVSEKVASKKTEAETPAEVLKIAAQIEESTKLSKEASLEGAWKTYLRYVNPDFEKKGGKPPPFMAKKDAPKDAGKAKGKAKAPAAFGGKMAPPFKAKSAAARELAEKLGMGDCAPPGPMPAKGKAPADKKALIVKSAAAKDLAKALGV